MKMRWTVRLENKKAQTIADDFWEIFETAKCKPNLIDKHDGYEYVIQTFCDFSEQNSNERFSSFTSEEAVFAARFNITIPNLLKKQVLEKGNAN